jgi:hypothetical protein
MKKNALSIAIYTVLRDRLRHDGQRKVRGEPVELPERQAGPLLQLGAIELRDAAGETAGTFTPSEDAAGVVAVQEVVGEGTGTALPPLQDAAPPAKPKAAKAARAPRAVKAKG